MFPHTITIYNVINNIFIRRVVSDVFYLSEKILSQDGNGEKFTNTHRVIFSSEALKKYTKKSDFDIDSENFTLNENDIIVKGEVGNIQSQNDLEGYDYFLIKTISDNSDYGSEELRNIEVTD